MSLNCYQLLLRAWVAAKGSCCQSSGRGLPHLRDRVGHIPHSSSPNKGSAGWEAIVKVLSIIFSTSILVYTLFPCFLCVSAFL